MFNVPVLFIVFNRPEETRLVFEKIRSVKPGRLFIVADGPREDRPQEELLCKEVRSIVSNVDWDCEVKTDFKIKNVGPEVSIKNALAWFFNEVEFGIILEDDCLPNPSFFTYCELLLKKFSDDETVTYISGSNFYDKRLSSKYNYFTGDMGSTWGWASWARVFKEFKWGNNYELSQVKNKMTEVYGEEYTRDLFEVVRNSYENEGNWDVEFFAHNLMNNKKSIIPSLNLVSNIGVVGTHFNNFNNDMLFVKTHGLLFDKTFEEKYTEMPLSIKRKMIKSILEKQNPLTLRDRLYYLKNKIIAFFKS